MSETTIPYSANDAESFETSWTQAEQGIFQHLVFATNTIDGKSAFLGVNPGIINAWHFQAEPTTELTTPIYRARDPQVMAMQYVAVARYQTREACQRWIMSIIKVLPICSGDIANVLKFQIDRTSGIEYESVSAANEKQVFSTWNIAIYFDLVFKTGSKD